MIDLFVYGTLMAPALWRSIVAGNYCFEEGVLHDYLRKKVSGEVYPGLIPSTGASVKGILYYTITDRDTCRLDTFEGSDFERITVPIKTMSGKIVRCQTYYLKPALHYRLTTTKWSYEDFLKDGFERITSLHTYSDSIEMHMKHVHDYE
jgi:gamma-glutamylcyclotransferase (GGCT)/AIG2-like uncharacterized protein YtfP